MMELSNCTNFDDRDKVPSNVRVECANSSATRSLQLDAAGCKSQLVQQDVSVLDLGANFSLQAAINMAISENVTLEDYPDYAQIPAVRLTFVVVYITIIFLTVCGNSLVVYTVAGQKKMHSSVNYLICNLAVSDLLVGAFVAPMKLLELLAPAHLQLLNNALCTALTFATSVAIFSTILTLLVISMERFFAIVYPLESRRFSKRFRTKLYIALTWIVAALLSGPTLIGSTHVAYTLSSPHGHLDVSICVYDEYDAVHPHFRKGYFLFLFFALYCIPMLIIIVTSILIVKTLIKTGGLISRECDLATQRQAENRRKVATMMIIVSFGFAVCWSPYFFVTVVVEYIYNYFPQGQFVSDQVITPSCKENCRIELSSPD
ncbi:hypothetical protein RvY_17390-2 [Ramazzottius varieornatus]|uniref:G-protein coupled receptors family 1 profile domain-containing protein n=1 Tax=Ramazzottius varieornatus TaxID=947166 RepID=A0A1D1W911_RAMVA|nr:hypothetical protein RvY_17390-2 [Ramazzottius varieornatus]